MQNATKTEPNLPLKWDSSKSFTRGLTESAEVCFENGILNVHPIEGYHFDLAMPPGFGAPESTTPVRRSRKAVETETGTGGAL